MKPWRFVVLGVLAACGSESTAPMPAAGAGSDMPEVPAVVADAEPPPVRNTLVEKTRIELPALGSIQRLVVQPDGKLLVIGEDGIVRVGADLAIDRSFGNAGVVKLELAESKLQTATVDERGRVIVVGHVWSKKHVEDLLVVRLKPDGKLDGSFANAGIFTEDFGRTDDRPADVFAMPSGDLVIIGSHQQGEGGQNYEAYLRKLDGRGKPAAKVTFFDCIPASREFVTRALLEDGAFLVGGYAFNANAETSGVFVARVGEDGKLDAAFGERGVRRVHVSAHFRSVAWELALAKNGDILLGGQSGETGDDYRGFIVRLDRRGSIPPTWGEHGVAWAAKGMQWISMAFDDGTGVLAASRFDGALLRFDDHGAIDRAFGTDGIVHAKKDDTFDNGVVLANGDVVVVGDKLLVRYAR